MEVNLGFHHGESIYNIMASTYGLHISDIQSRTQAKGACGNCQNSAHILSWTPQKWAELLPHIEEWINNTVSNGTGYNPTELMYGVKRPNVFDKVMPKVQGLEQEEEDTAAKLEAAY